MSTLLTIDKLTVANGQQTVVQPLSFSLACGQTLALVGESGCGKTSTALAIAGLLPSRVRTTGRVFFEGVDLLSLRPGALRRYQGKEIGVIFQEPLSSLNPVLNVQTQIDELLHAHTELSRPGRRLRIMESLDRVGLPSPEQIMKRFPHELSGGQRQRVMIAMAVACQPKLLIADEPTTALDVTTQQQILELIAELKQDLNMAVLLISHDLAVVSEQAEQMIVMHNGFVQEQGPTHELIQTPTHPYTKALIGASLSIDANRHYRNTHQLFTDTATPRSDQPPLLQLEGIHKSFGQGEQRHTAINNLSMAIAPNETVGLVGESGCGKSTLSRVIMQLLPADAGRIHYADEPIAGPNAASTRQWRRKVQMVFQDPYGSLNPRLTIGRLFERLQKLHFPHRSRHERKLQAADILDAVRLPVQSLHRYPHEFSGGQRQRIAIARCLLLQPELLICDEPVSALDVSVQAQILDLFIELKQEFSLSYLFISHDLAVVRYIADRILVMHHGQIVETQYHDQRQWTAPQHPYTQHLLAATPRFSHSLTQGKA